MKTAFNDLLPESATKGKASNWSILNIQLIKSIKKMPKSWHPWVFLWTKQGGGNHTEKSHQSPFQCRQSSPASTPQQQLPKVSRLHFYSVALFSIPELLMELKSMTISVLLGLNCLPKHKGKKIHIQAQDAQVWRHAWKKQIKTLVMMKVIMHVF